MLHSRQGSQGTRLWVWLGLGAIALVSFLPRFWQLERFNELVFDEVYYVKYAYKYLQQQPLFDAHPPLGKYMIALGIWLGQHGFPGAMPTNEAAGAVLSPLWYRWMNAFVGGWIPLLVAGIAYELTRRSTFMVVAGLLAALDGFLLVESRLALLHVYLVGFGLLGHWCFLKGVAASGVRRWGWLVGAGLGFGGCVAVKWNGLAYVAGPLLVWAWVWVKTEWDWLTRRTPLRGEERSAIVAAEQAVYPLQRLRSVSAIAMIVCLVLIPAAVYVVQWLPHLDWNDIGFRKVHEQILGFHQRMGGNSKKVHPYCSPWWTWPLVTRPIAYFFRKSADGKWWFDIHALGNPFLWWFSTGAIALFSVRFGLQGVQRGWPVLARWAKGPVLEPLLGGGPLFPVRQEPRAALFAQWGVRPLPKATDGEMQSQQMARVYNGVMGYLLVNYLLNWLPWAKVTRCTFIYHHLGSAVFGMLAIGLLVTRWLQVRPEDRFRGRYWSEWRLAGVAVLVLVAIAFVFWLPLFLGLPLSPTVYRWRIWLPSWI